VLQLIKEDSYHKVKCGVTRVAVFKNDVIMAVDRNGDVNYMGYAYLAIVAFGVTYGELGRIIQSKRSYKSPHREVPVTFSVVVPAVRTEEPETSMSMVVRREDIQA
jgi:hypothetical protein